MWELTQERNWEKNKEKCIIKKYHFCYDLAGLVNINCTKIWRVKRLEKRQQEEKHAKKKLMEKICITELF
jgi:hypothetical protein